ncbi:MAG: serine hydrolase, partial [Oscillospiraceae bacterium]|nr:serine hydrolase [Oscillospiraceae bacterium]
MRCVFKTMMILAVSAALSVLLLGADKKEDISAYSYIVIEADTGMMIEGVNADKKANISYLSKLMAILLIAEDIDQGEYTVNDVLTASDSVTGTKGSVIWLKSGDTLSVDELLKSVIIGNANDA